MKIEMRVAELLASRLCHELISPVGAVGNGLELLEEEGSGMAAEALELSIRSVRRASALLQFYRIAYGAAGSLGSVRLADARALAAGILDGGKIRLAWPDLPEQEALPGLGKLLLNMVLLAVEALPRGGEIAVGVAASGSDGTLATARASGQDARLSDEMRATLVPAGSAEGLSAKTVHGYFLSRLSEMQGGRLELAAPEPGTVRIEVLIPPR